MALPTLRALNNIFEGKLSIVYNKSKINEYILSEFNFRNIIEIEFTKVNEERAFNSFELSKQMKECDLLIYLNTWINLENIQILLKNLHDLKNSIGFYTCFKTQIEYSTTIHNFDLYFRMVHIFNKKLLIQDFSYPPVFNENYKKIIKEIEKNKVKNIKYLAIHFDSEPEKSLKREIYHKLLEKILENRNDIYLVPIGLEQIELSEKYEQRILYFNQPLPFIIATAYLETADFFIGVDSCFLHISDLNRIPSIGIFGPTSEVEFGFRFGINSMHISSKMGRIRDIKSHEIYKKLKQLLNVKK